MQHKQQHETKCRPNSVVFAHKLREFESQSPVVFAFSTSVFNIAGLSQLDAFVTLLEGNPKGTQNIPNWMRGGYFCYSDVHDVLPILLETFRTGYKIVSH